MARAIPPCRPERKEPCCKRFAGNDLEANEVLEAHHEHFRQHRIGYFWASPRYRGYDGKGGLGDSRFSRCASREGNTDSSRKATGQPMTRAQVDDMIKKIADQQREELDWRRSIVDLMKLLKLDSGLNARKELAQELGYKGALTGSAEMNVWLHEQVMQKLAESGGVVPDSLKHA